MASKQSTPLWFWDEPPQKGQQQDVGEGFRGCEVNSSAIGAMAYNSEDRKLIVTFNSGKSYAYYGVSPQRYAAFCDAESKGRYFSRNIRNEYVHRRLG